VEDNIIYIYIDNLYLMNYCKKKYIIIIIIKKKNEKTRCRRDYDGAHTMGVKFFRGKKQKKNRFFDNPHL